MLRSARFILSSLLVLAVPLPALAYTPESGIWWSPAEPGTGLQIEIQDNFLALSGYVFEPGGAPTWVTAQGFLDATGWNFNSTESQTDASWLSTFQGGQCIGCEYTGPPSANLGSQGQIRLSFDPANPTRAVLVWGGRLTQIERFEFYLRRPGDSAGVVTTKMLGEWNVLLDLTKLATPDATRFEGDVLVIDQINFAPPPAVSSVAGCRPPDALLTSCTPFAAATSDLTGSFDQDRFRYLILLTDTRDDNGDPQDCLLYDVRVQTNLFEGGMDGDLDSSNDGGVIAYPCGAGNAFEFAAYPVRGFRSASRTRVEERVTPAKDAGSFVETSARDATARLQAKRLDVVPASDDPQMQRRIELVRSLERRLGVPAAD